MGTIGLITVTYNKTVTVTITPVNLNPGQNVTGTANYTITLADLDNGSMTSAAFATGKFGNNIINSNTTNMTF